MFLVKTLVLVTPNSRTAAERFNAEHDRHESSRLLYELVRVEGRHKVEAIPKPSLRAKRGNLASEKPKKTRSLPSNDYGLHGFGIASSVVSQDLIVLLVVLVILTRTRNRRHRRLAVCSLSKLIDKTFLGHNARGGIQTKKKGSRRFPLVLNRARSWAWA